MKLKKIMLVTFVLLAILTIGAASAADDTLSEDLAVSDDVDEVSVDASVDCDVISEDSGDEVAASSEDDVISDGNSTIGDENTQVELQDKIENTAEGDTLVLDKDYAFTGLVSEGNPIGISINKAITIDGKGHTIDANGYCTIFAIDAPDITLLSITFKNGYVNGDFSGAAIGGGNSGLTVINCTFENNEAIDRPNAGAIGMQGDNITIMNSVFMSNAGFENGGAIEIRGNNARISDCHFRSNRLPGSNTKGGAIFILGESGTISNCLFENHTADYGGDICIMGPQDNFVIEDCSSDGGEVNIDFYEGDDSGVELWIDTENVFTIAGPDDLAQIFATVTVDDGVQGNVLFVIGDEGLYNTQLDEFDPEDIEDNVYKIALGNGSQFIFETLSSFDIFEFSFLMEGSDEPFITKKYMILLENDTVRFIDYDNIVKLWINTEDVFSTDDLSQIFATVTAADGVQGNVLFVIGDEALYNKQLDEFAPEDIEDNVYNIALGDDEGRFIFKNLESGDVFDFLFLLGGSDETFVSKQYMIFFDDDTVRFEEYHDDAYDGVIIYVEDGSECQYHLDVQDDAEASFAWVSVRNDLEGSIAIFVYGEDENEVYFFEKSLDDIEDNMSDENNDGFTRYFIHFNDIDDLDGFKNQERFTLAFIDNENNVADSRDYEVNYIEEENVIYFFEAGNDDKGEELDSVIFVSGNVITNDAIIFIPENLSNEFDDDFEVIILNDDGDDVRPFKFSEIESFEGFFQIQILDLFGFEDIGESMGVNFIVQFYKDGEKAAYGQPEDDEFGIEVYTSPFVNGEAYILEDGWVVSFRGFEDVDDEFTVTISQEGAADINKTFKISELEHSDDDYAFYELHLSDLQITEPGEYAIEVIFTKDGDSFARDDGTVNVGTVLVRAHGPDDDEDPVISDILTRIFHIGASENVAGFARLFVDGVQVGENISFADLEFDDWPSHYGRQIYLNNYHITESGNYTLKVEVYDENGEFLADCENVVEIEVGENKIEFFSGPYGSDGGIDFIINAPLEEGQYYNLYLNGELAGNYTAKNENGLVISDKYLDEYFEVKIFKPGTYDVKVTFFDGETERDVKTGSFTKYSLNLTSDKETYIYGVDPVLISFRLAEILEDYRLDAYYLNYWDRMNMEETMVFNPYGYEGILGEMYDNNTKLVTFDVAWFKDPENSNYRLDLGTNYIHVTYRPWNGEGIEYGGIIAVNVVNSTEPTKEDPMINVTVDSVVYGNDLVINIRGPDGPISITVDGNTYTIGILYGVGTLIINNLNAGTYIVTVDYAGDDEYYAYTNQTVAEVLKADSSFTMNETVFYYAEEITFNYTLIGADGFMGIAIGDYPEGEEPYATWDDVGYLHGFTVGNFTVQFTTVPDENHNAVVVNYNITILEKPTLNLTVNVADINYGEELVAVVSSDMDVEVYVMLDDDEGSMLMVQIENGNYYWNLTEMFPEMMAGDHLLTVIFPGDENYNETIVRKYVTINKVDSSFTMNETVFDYSEDGEIHFNYTVIGGEGFEAVVIGYSEDDEPYATWDDIGYLYYFPAGNFTIQFTTIPDDNHNAVVVNYTITINKIASSVNVEDVVVYEGENIIVPTIVDGATGVNASVIDYPDANITYTSDGVVISGLAAGEYTLKVVTIPDENHYAAETNMTITVKQKLVLPLTVTAADITYGDDLVAIISSDEDVEVYVWLDDDEGSMLMVQIENGTAEWTLNVVYPGVHVVTVRFPGNEDYAETVVNTAVSVSKLEVPLVIDADDVFVGAPFTVEFIVEEGATGNVSVTINEMVMQLVIDENSGSAIFALQDGMPEGNYTIYAVYSGDERFASSSATANVTVKQKPTLPLTITADDITYGEDLFVLISAGADVDVGVKLDDAVEGVIYFVQIVNGSGNCTFSNVNSGLHTVTVSFPGDDDYAETVVSKNVTVNKAPSTIEISNYTIDYGKAASIPIVKTGATGVNATFVENPNIDVTISDNAISFNGDVNAGNYTLKVVTVPDENHYSVEATATVTVNKIDSTLNVSDVVFDFGKSGVSYISYSGILYVTASVVGHPEAIVDKQDTEIVISNLDAGTYTLSVITVPDVNHNSVEVNATVTVNKVNASFALDADVFDYAEEFNVTFSVDGAEEIMPSIVDNPEVDFVWDIENNVMTIFDLNAGTHTLNVQIDPDANHNATEVNITIVVNKVDSSITLEKTVFDYAEEIEVNYTLVGADDFDGEALDCPGASVSYEGVVFLRDFTAGTHVVQFTTVPDENHNEVVVNVTITINKVPSTVEVEDASALYGNPLIVPVTFTNAIGVNASVVDYPDADITYTSDGIIINGLAVGNYTLNVATVVDDNHAVAVDTASITVNEKPVLPLTVDVADITYGDDLFVLISAGADVGVGVKLDDAAESVFNFVQIVNGSGNFTFSDVNSGVHTVTVMFIGNEDYAETVVSKNVTVNKAPSTVTVEDASALYGQSVIVPVSFTDAEFINATVVGYPDANIIYTSDGIVISGLAVGNYTLKVVTITDENHEAAEATANIAVNRAIVTKENFNDYFTEDGTLRQDLPELVFVGNFEAKNINIDKPVTLIGENAKLKDVQFNVISDNVAIINMDVNNNNVNPVIAADGVFNFTLANNVIVLDTVSDKVAVVLVNNSDKVTIRDNFITASGKNFVDGILISDSNFTISTNVITVSTSNTAEGIHIMGSSNGDVTDNDVDVRANVTVFGMNTTVINPAFRCNITFSFNVIYGEAVYAVGINDDSETIDNNKVTLKANQAVGVIVNSENAQVTENTIKLIAAESQAGQDNDAVGVQVNAKSVISSNDIDSFGKSISVDNGDGTLVSNNNANAAMSISATSTKITGNEITTVDEKAVYVLDTATGTVIDDNVLTANGVNGNDAVSNAGTGTEVKNNKAKPQLAVDPIADVFEGQGVVIVITADKNFTGDVKLQLGNANSNVSIINGSGKVNVAGDKLAVGEVIVKVIFDGNDKYTNDTVNTTFTVKAKVVTAIQATAVTTTYGTSKNIVVTLKDANGNALADKKVTVVLNGAKKELTTDAKGQASYAVGTKLAVKTHTATITFDGDTEHAKSTGTVNVVVKKATPKLTAKKKTFKVKKAKKYTIVLKTDKGKALSKAKVTLTGKFKGKKIKVTVKTNSKGKATFNLKKLTKKGKFTATVKFAGNKNYKSVTKKAKITVKK